MKDLTFGVPWARVQAKAIFGEGDFDGPLWENLRKPSANIVRCC
jgi:hypothetical protein